MKQFSINQEETYMGLRMRKSITISKGIRLNIGKTGTSLSTGTSGLRQTIHSSGRRTTSIGIPGTGLSYVTSSGSSNQHAPSANASSGYRSSSHTQRQQEKYNEQQQNSAIFQEHENFVESIKSLHKICDEGINWNHINSIKEPYNPNGMGPRQAAAHQAINNFRPSLIQKAIKSVAESKKAALVHALENAIIEDKAEYEEWENLKVLSERILVGDIEAYFEVIKEMNPLDDLLEFGSDFEFGTENSSTMEVEFRVKSEQIVPKFSMSLLKSGKLSKKEYTKTLYYELVQDYVCSCTIRIARDMFALLPLKMVVVHAVDNILNSETGHYDDATILSIVFDRDTLSKLNFDNLDPSDAMNNFKHNMKFFKTLGCKPVDRIENY
jgi:hypothetical protein